MLQHRSVSGEPRFPSHLFLEQRSPPPPPPPPTLLSSGHPVPTPSPLPFTQPGPAFNQQGQQPVFPRERPARPALQPPGPVGLLHFSQPGSTAARPFMPPRQPFLPGPGQPFLPTHTQPSLQVSVAGCLPPCSRGCGPWCLGAHNVSHFHSGRGYLKNKGIKLQRPLY